MTHPFQRLRSIYRDHPTTCDVLLITLAYVLSHGLSFLNRGVFWDDWILYNADIADYRETFRQAGAAWVAFLHRAVSSCGVGGYRAVVLIGNMVSAGCLYGVSSRLPLGRAERLFVVIYFAIFPVNSARIAMINMPSSVCYALFFTGLWLTSRYLRSHNILHRLAAVPLLFVSFAANSILVFYLLVILFIMYEERQTLTTVRGCLRFLLRFADYLFLPILFWVVRSEYMRPHGLYADYNRISSSHMLNAPWQTFGVFDTSFLAVTADAIGVGAIVQSTAFPNRFLLPALVMGIVGLLVVRRSQVDQDYRELHRTMVLFGLGVLAFWLAAFPYVVVDKIPGQQDWNSRWQLLTPLGAALMLVYGVRLVSPRRVVAVATYVLLTVCFLIATVMSYVSFQRDWYKQLSLIANFKASPMIAGNTAFLFEDEATELNANGRFYRFYEYAGMMEEAFGGEQRFGEDAKIYTNRRNDITRYRPYMRSDYNLSQFREKEPDKVVTIAYGSHALGMASTVRLMLLELTDRPAFEKAVREVVTLQVRDRQSALENALRRRVALNYFEASLVAVGGPWRLEWTYTDSASVREIVVTRSDGRTVYRGTGTVAFDAPPFRDVTYRYEGSVEWKDGTRSEPVAIEVTHHLARMGGVFLRVEPAGNGQWDLTAIPNGGAERAEYYFYYYDEAKRQWVILGTPGASPRIRASLPDEVLKLVVRAREAGVIGETYASPMVVLKKENAGAERN